MISAEGQKTESEQRHSQPREERMGAVSNGTDKHTTKYRNSPRCMGNV